MATTTKRFVTIGSGRYLIRGTGVTASDLRKRYAAFVAKFPGTGLTFEQWAVERGGVYFRVAR